MADGRVAAVIVLIPVFLRASASRTAPADRVRAMIIGAGAAIGLVLYQLALHQQLLAIVVALASLYPALPVVLGVVIHHEKLNRVRVIGLISATVAVVLLSLG